MNPFPVLVTFPQGVPEDADSLNVTVKKQIRGKYARHIVSVNGDGVNLCGFDFGEFSKEKDTCEYAVAIWNEDNSKFEVVKAEHVYSLRTVFDEEHATKSNESLSLEQRRKTLTKEFGSKKKKRAMQSAESNTILVDNISGASAIEQMLLSSSSGVNIELIEDAQKALMKSGKKRK